MLEQNEWVDMDQFQAEMGFDSSTTHELYEIFAEELSEEIDKLEAATDRDYITKIVHNIKGITASYKAGAALMQAVQVDLLCKGEQWEAYDQNLTVFIKTLRQTVDTIRDLLGKVG